MKNRSFADRFSSVQRPEVGDIDKRLVEVGAGEPPVGRAGFAEVGQHNHRTGEIVIQRVIVDRDQRFQARAQTRAQAVFRILESQAIGRVQSHFFQRVMINVGRRFFGRHDIARRNDLEPVLGA